MAYTILRTFPSLHRLMHSEQLKVLYTMTSHCSTLVQSLLGSRDGFLHVLSSTDSLKLHVSNHLRGICPKAMSLDIMSEYATESLGALGLLGKSVKVVEKTFTVFKRGDAATTMSSNIALSKE